MFAPLALLVAGLAALAALARRLLQARRLPARAMIVSPRKSTVVSKDAGVRSVQSAELTLDRDELDRIWAPANLENLARTYWAFLSRMTLGLVRVVYGEHTRSVVLIARPLTLLRFDAPEYQMHENHGSVRWRIRGGLLVARAGREGAGYLALDVRREPDDGSGKGKLKIEVEVANFYPSIAAGFSMPVYEMTQSTIHVLVTHAFLRSLARLQLVQSRIGSLSEAVLDAVTPDDDPLAEGATPAGAEGAGVAQE